MNIKELFDQGMSREEIEKMVMDAIAAEADQRQPKIDMAAVEAARKALVEKVVEYASALKLVGEVEAPFAAMMMETTLRQLERETLGKPTNKVDLNEILKDNHAEAPYVRDDMFKMMGAKKRPRVEKTDDSIIKDFLKSLE